MSIERTWLTPDELAVRLGVTSKTVGNWRVMGKGPKFRKLAPKIICYPIEEVVSWEEAHPLIQSASEYDNDE